MAKPIPYSLSRPSKAPPNALPFIHPSPNKSCYPPSLPPSIPLKRNKKQKSKAKKQKAATTPPSPQKNATFNVCPCCLVHSHREKKRDIQGEDVKEILAIPGLPFPRRHIGTPGAPFFWPDYCTAQNMCSPSKKK